MLPDFPWELIVSNSTGTNKSSVGSAPFSIQPHLQYMTVAGTLTSILIHTKDAHATSPDPSAPCLSHFCWYSSLKIIPAVVGLVLFAPKTVTQCPVDWQRYLIFFMDFSHCHLDCYESTYLIRYPQSRSTRWGYFIKKSGTEGAEEQFHHP